MLFKLNRWNKFPSARDKLKFLGVDMHNHLLPGLDDGSKSLEDSFKLLSGLQELGLEQFICTPHVMEGVYPNNVDSIFSVRDSFNTYLSTHGIETKVASSAEYMIDSSLRKLIDTDQLCVIAGEYVLVEMSYLAESRELFQIIFDIQKKGYKPILAHPERYSYYHNRKDVFRKIKDAGCYLQLNLLSISRYYGAEVRSVASQLIKSGMYDFVGTDLHHDKHLIALNSLLEKYPVERMLKNCNLKNRTLLDSL